MRYKVKIIMRMSLCEHRVETAQTCFLSSFRRAISAAFSSLLIPVKLGVDGVGVDVFRSAGSQPSVSGGGGDDTGVERTLVVDVIDGDRAFDGTDSFLG